MEFFQALIEFITDFFAALAEFLGWTIDYGDLTTTPGAEDGENADAAE